MKIIITILLFVSSSVLADDCSKIAKYDDEKSTIYVVCPNLPDFKADKAGNLVNKIFKSRNFVPDEYLIYFVASLADVYSKKIKPSNFIGRYYTHDNQLTIWPKIPYKKRTIQLTIK